jgi:CO/xanthine dehydrogenase Mo-binding subunit
VLRKEDRRLLMGRGKYAADFRLPGLLHAAVLRSPTRTRASVPSAPTGRSAFRGWSPS